MNTNPYFIQKFAAEREHQLLAQGEQARLVKDATPRSHRRVRRLVLWSARRSPKVRPATAG
jgi:hypothetical protein